MACCNCSARPINSNSLMTTYKKCSRPRSLIFECSTLHICLLLSLAGSRTHKTQLCNQFVEHVYNQLSLCIIPLQLQFLFSCTSDILHKVSYIYILRLGASIVTRTENTISFLVKSFFNPLCFIQYFNRTILPADWKEVT